MKSIPPPSPVNRPVRRLTWLLLLLLAVAGLFAGMQRSPELPDPDRFPFARHSAMPLAPEPVRAIGEMAEVYERARTATVRIESRCSNPLYGSTPVDVGSGFFVSPDGRLLTAYHVIRRQALAAPARCGLEYVAVDAHERVHRLELVGFDAYLDLALLQADVSDGVPYLRLAAEPPPVGSQVVAIGNSRGEFLGDRAGNVTRLGVRSRQPDFASGTIELTAALAPGDSGGPVLARDSSVLGVVSYISFEPAVMSADGDALLSTWFGVGDAPGFASYAVPVLAGSEALAELQTGARRDVPVIGFEVAYEYDPRSRDTPGLGRRAGVVVGRVQPNGPGEAAGLRSLRERRALGPQGQTIGTRLTADVIVAVDGRATPTFTRLLEVVRERSVGERVVLTVQRGDRSMEVALELAGYRQVFR
ncbi:MAG: S1C family serine protease [Trueperaceae bacterium]